jgi:hypothetical protein
LAFGKGGNYMGWDLFGWKFIGTHLGGILFALVGAVMAFASPDTQFPAYLLLLIIGCLGIAAGQVDAALLRRIERLEETIAAQMQGVSAGRPTSGSAERGAPADRPRE